MIVAGKISGHEAERAALLLGIVMLSVYTGTRLNGEYSRRAALNQFKSLRATGSINTERVREKIDFTVWSPKRIRAYRESLSVKTDPALAVLFIPKIHLEVPVFEGTDDVTLNRGAGRIIGTARIGEQGNIGIAAHRDGFFRGLKDVAPGDTIDLVTPNKTTDFVIDWTEVVEPEDVGVLADTGTFSLTLVTCFPFHFVGSAPQRFVVHASSKDFDGLNRPPNTLAGQIQSEGDLK